MTEAKFNQLNKDWEEIELKRQDEEEERIERELRRRKEEKNEGN